MRVSRRSFLAALAGAPLVRNLQLPQVAKPILQPRYYEASVPISLDELNRVTRDAFYPTFIEDNFFRETPLLEHLRKHSRDEPAKSESDAWLGC